MQQNPLVICFILDETRSMVAIKSETISGFNEYLEILKNDESSNSALFALTKFNSDKIELVYDSIPLEKVEPLSDQNYHPVAITPLYDAIGRTINALKTKNEDSPVLIVIQTDGQENASKEFSKKMIRDLIEERQKSGWTFAFLGADIDAYTASSVIGISKGNTANYVGRESLAAFRKAARAATAYTATGGTQTDKFFDNQKNDLLAFHKQVNLTRFHNQTKGHYESFFLRANHPTRPLAFWIRYTLFSPKDHPENNIGELWAIFFNGESNQHIVAKQEYPLVDCLFDTNDFNIQTGSAKLSPGFVQGAIESKGNKLVWEMTFDGDSLPLLLLPLQLYQGKFPTAKSLVSLPLAHFNGVLSVNDEKINIIDWVGSQNHNWGLRHTDLYAWGQVAGFDSHPDSFLEVATAKLKLGPFLTPPITLLVLRHHQKEYALTELMQGIKARGEFRYFNWEFKSKTKDVEIEGKISAPSRAFIGLNYYNPPGGNKYCLNSKIAQGKLRFKDKTTGKVEQLETKHRAAFEILTNDQSHGITISA